jgi:diguanylate cyclase (GGDEF)-like protein
MLLCAVYQDQADFTKILRKTLRIKTTFLPFSSFVQLESLIKKHNMDLVAIAGSGSFKTELNLAKRMKRHPILSLIPLVLYHPEHGLKTALDGFKYEADEIFSSQSDQRLISAKLKMIIDRSRRDLGVNPTTRLPGTNIIEREITRRMKRGEEFAACYADLDNFKAYNDYYGYQYGDGLIKTTSEIIRDVVYSRARKGFVGHIGGDDFVFVVSPEDINPICSEIIDIFDRMIIRRYKKEDVIRGYIITSNRKGKNEKFPLMTLSIAVIVNQKRMFRHLGEISHMIADLKKYTKSLPGSNYFVERRKKY